MYELASPCMKHLSGTGFIRLFSRSVRKLMQSIHRPHPVLLKLSESTKFASEEMTIFMMFGYAKDKKRELYLILFI